MLRDVPSYRHLIEICHSGLEEEKTFIGRLLAAHRESCEAEGIRLDVVQRGVVPGQVMITVGGGAEAQALRMVEWTERWSGRPERLDVYIHPHSLPRPLFFLLPGEAGEAKRQLGWIVKAREIPETAALPALAAAPRRRLGL